VTPPQPPIPPGVAHGRDGGDSPGDPGGREPKLTEAGGTKAGVL
jgi:hypothetical protein